jgi:hypothetical protein
VETKLEKTDRVEIMYRGIGIASRYGIAAEINQMKHLVDEIPERLRADVIRVFCDSKVGSCFSVDRRSKARAKEIASVVCFRLDDVSFHVGNEVIYDWRLAL